MIEHILKNDSKQEQEIVEIDYIKKKDWLIGKKSVYLIGNEW